ncbi:MAG: peptidase dimerization domain-containing protein, partial [Promethearchaeota archaeon]
SFAVEREFLVPIKIIVEGLIGGHSGVDIHKGRPNAIKILAQLLWKLNRKYKIHLNSFKGGTWKTAISKNSQAIVFIKENSYSKINDFVKEFCSDIQHHYDGIEEKIEISLEKLKDFMDNTYFSINYQYKLLNILYSMPYGPYSFHSINRNLVHTSNNIGPIR